MTFLNKKKLSERFCSSGGWTFVELLVVLTVIVILAGITYEVYGYLPKARDAQRVDTMQSFKKALTLYYQQYKHYPSACGTDSAGYKYYSDTCSGTEITADLLFSDSIQYFMADNNLIDQDEPEKSLQVSGFINTTDWVDPLTGFKDLSTEPRYNCRYIIPKISLGADGCPDPMKYMEIQKYYIHCALEKEFDISMSDGGHGLTDELYELYEPSPWIGCLQYSS